MTVVKPDLLINCKDLGDLMKLDLDKKNMFMKLKGMNIGFSTISTITKLKETSDQQCSLRFHLFTMVMFNSFQLLQKNFLTKVQCLTTWSEIQ